MGVRSVFRENMLLEVYDPRDDLYYKSIIQEVDDDYIAIGMPMRKQKHLYMARHTKWDFRLTSKDTLFYFTSRCLGSKKSGRISLYLINWPDEVKRVQRREYYRFPCSFDTHYWILKKPWDEKEQTPQPPAEAEEGQEGTAEKTSQEEVSQQETTKEEVFQKEASPEEISDYENISLDKLAKHLGDPGKSMISDLSGGGVQLVAPQWLPIGTILLMALFLESKKKNKTLFVKGKVVWVGPYQPERTVHFRHAVEFVDTPDRVREEIVGFIFILMRERMV